MTRRARASLARVDGAIASRSAGTPANWRRRRRTPRRRARMPPVRVSAKPTALGRARRDCPSSCRRRRSPARPRRRAARRSETIHRRRPPSARSRSGDRRCARDQDRDRPTTPPDREAAAADQQRLAARPSAVRARWVVRRPGENEREQQRRDAVVEQALALDQQPEPAGDAGLAQQRDDRDRIGRGDQRAEGERGSERPAEPRRAAATTPAPSKTPIVEAPGPAQIAPELAP